MFWKLCKHELKCSYRSFLVLYAIVVAAALVMNPNNDGMLDESGGVCLCGDVHNHVYYVCGCCY